jgi:hypothetical protein
MMMARKALWRPDSVIASTRFQRPIRFDAGPKRLGENNLIYDFLQDPEWEWAETDKDWRMYIHPLVQAQWQNLTYGERLVAYGAADLMARASRYFK